MLYLLNIKKVYKNNEKFNSIKINMSFYSKIIFNKFKNQYLNVF